MQPALLLGRLIYGDIVYGNSHSWGYWKGMEVNGDHALIAVYPKEGRLENGGSVRANKMMWALGNYSFFIRPDYTRISLMGADDLNSLVASAYMAPDSSRLVVVYVNSSFEPQNIKISFPETYYARIKSLSAYRTDERSDLANMCLPEIFNPENKYLLPPRSLVTMVFDIN